MFIPEAEGRTEQQEREQPRETPKPLGSVDVKDEEVTIVTGYSERSGRNRAEPASKERIIHLASQRVQEMSMALQTGKGVVTVEDVVEGRASRDDIMRAADGELYIYNSGGEGGTPLSMTRATEETVEARFEELREKITAAVEAKRQELRFAEQDEAAARLRDTEELSDIREREKVALQNLRDAQSEPDGSPTRVEHITHYRAVVDGLRARRAEILTMQAGV